MAMFNSNLTSSLSGWFTNKFQPNPEDSSATNEEKSQTEENIKQTPEEEVSEKPVETEKDDNKVESEETNNEETSTETTNSLDKMLDIDTEQMQKKLAEETQKVVSSAMSFGNYLFGVATEASKKMSTTVNETAQTLKKTVEDKTILGDLNREQDEFIRQKREKQGDGAVPPWCGYQEEETMKQQILALSTDTRNFLRSPPSGVQFNFEFEQMFPIAKATLKEDENLKKMRFTLVPTKIKEELFWRNYFYRVSLIKQSAQLSSLTELQKTGAGEAASSASSTSSIVMVGSTATGTMSRSSSNKSLNRSDAETAGAESHDTADINEPDELPAAEFASDAFDPSTLNPDDLEREMRELGMDDGGTDIPEWEHELQKELQDYEVVNGEGKDDMWEKEIDDMLNADAEQVKSS
uniref:Synapse-associated protein 1 n=1 Tax=Phallusia mammillata TaxID=59560 RepID=A0A6F9DUP0_9ASCI|nr:synapse-associated protein 1 [Phallusia mammillata]